MGGGDAYAGTVEVENDATIGTSPSPSSPPLSRITRWTHPVSPTVIAELGWLSEATTFADAYLARLQDPSIPDPLAGLPGTGDAAAHAALYKAFRCVFPTLDVGCLDPEDPLG